MTHDSNPEPDSLAKNTDNDPSLKHEIIALFGDKQLPGITINDPASEAGRRIIGFYFSRILANESGTRSGFDPKAVHDMRVATRRTRVALTAFSPLFTKKTIKPFRNQLRKITKALAALRDYDVFIDALRNFVHGLPEQKRSEYRYLLAEWGRLRKDAVAEVRQFLDSAPYQAFIISFGRFVTTPNKGVKKNTSVQSQQISEFVPGLVMKQLARLKKYDLQKSNASLKKLHSLRIQLKKLRYLLEFFKEILGSDINEVKKMIVGLQDQLGRINDAHFAGLETNRLIQKLSKINSSDPIVDQAHIKLLTEYQQIKNDEITDCMTAFLEDWPTIFRTNIAETVSERIASF